MNDEKNSEILSSEYSPENCSIGNDCNYQKYTETEKSIYQNFNVELKDKFSSTLNQNVIFGISIIFCVVFVTILLTYIIRNMIKKFSRRQLERQKQKIKDYKESFKQYNEEEGCINVNIFNNFLEPKDKSKPKNGITP
uniref:Plasmodium vivax Vir protein n=1 Tax=Strongyloides venezuelensis TaxID=75913 RepID=A0A0K0EWJ2_STRVS